MNKPIAIGTFYGNRSGMSAKSDRVPPRQAETTIVAAARAPFFDVTVRVDGRETTVTRRGRWTDDDVDAAEISFTADLSGGSDSSLERASCMCHLVVDAEPRGCRGEFMLDLSALTDELQHTVEVEVSLRTPQVGGGSLYAIDGFAAVRLTTDKEGGLCTTSFGAASLVIDDAVALTCLPSLRIGGSGSGEQATQQFRNINYQQSSPPQRVGVRHQLILTGGDAARVEFRFGF